MLWVSNERNFVVLLAIGGRNGQERERDRNDKEATAKQFER
jgi:hypothetical protein